ncbi:GSCOCG00007317001-RA-CDS [Cotesia congregata]|uniref:Uncharacterized protein n=1 Tax=Cotesia congregata TaxID=51543 RepID=A0A8J2H5I2_COTCN|nr:GSCOCG00007317001-RA-CDS [Cotesia congregata]CAG5076072.1 Protein of unknown function [Cotesia congregata]
MPLNFSLRHAYLEAETDIRSLPMASNIYIITPIQHEQKCAGRSLATLLVSWVAVTMLGAILLRWKHMWIALTVLTLLFLMMCAYAIKMKRQVRPDQRDEQCIIQENINGAAVDNPEIRTRQIQTVSGSVDDFTEIIQPPAYQTFWINDLPPSYSAVIGEQVPPVGPRLALPNDTYATITSNPPPYCAVLRLETDPDNEMSSQNLNSKF